MLVMGFEPIRKEKRIVNYVTKVSYKCKYCDWESTSYSHDHRINFQNCKPNQSQVWDMEAHVRVDHQKLLFQKDEIALEVKQRMR